VGRYQKGKTNLDFTEARDSEWHWHQLGHMQVCTSLQADNHASTPPLSFLQAGCPYCRSTNSVKALKANSKKLHQLYQMILLSTGNSAQPESTQTKSIHVVLLVVVMDSDSVIAMNMPTFQLSAQNGMDQAAGHQLEKQLLICYGRQPTVIDCRCLPSHSSQLNRSQQLQASLATFHC